MKKTVMVIAMAMAAATMMAGCGKKAESTAESAAAAVSSAAAAVSSTAAAATSEAAAAVSAAEEITASVVDSLEADGSRAE